VTGTVRLDAAYAIAAAGARLARDGDTRIVRVGGTVLSNGGGQLVANNGAGLVSDGANRLRLPTRLLTLDDAPLSGETLPAAGVRISVRSLVTGAPLPVGATASGAHTFTLETDARGRYSVQLPAAEGGIVVEGRIPDASGQLAQDPGLTYDMCPPHDAAEVTLDEDTTAACRLLWQLLFNVLHDAMRDAPDGLHRRAELGAQQPLQPLTQAATRAGLAGGPPARLEAVAARCAEAIIGGADPWRVRVAGDGSAGAMEQFVTLLRRTREAATVKTREAPTALTSWPVLAAANAAREPGKPAWTLRKPADVNRFLSEAYTAHLAPQPDVTELLGPAAGQEPAWRQAATALVVAQFQALGADGAALQAQLVRIVETGPPRTAP
jgi:hypothetical protein